MKNRKSIGYERRILATALGALVPLGVTAIALAWFGGFDTKTLWTVIAVISVALFIISFVIHDQLAFPLRTLSNIVTAIREEDYSLRARAPNRDDALGEVMHEINVLSTMLEERKLEALEASALLRAVMAEVDAAILAFDHESRLRLINRAGERVLNVPAERVLGATAGELGLDLFLEEGAPATVERTFGGVSGRWSIRRSTFRDKGMPHRLLVITDITRALREEEAQAWQRLVRVLSHELNNSLAPIKSIAQTVETIANRDPLPDDWREDVIRGANVIAARADSLTRFTGAYARLARLPQPNVRTTDLGKLLQRVAALEPRLPVRVAPGPSTTVLIDSDQIEQLLINIIKNAVDASLETGGGVLVRWSRRNDQVTVEVIDDGPGLQSNANLFVPFFTTKPAGSGIGLVLGRQIAEAHGGTLTLENRTDGQGCVARLVLRT